MKVATVTWITFNNYGTQLQAYALQKYLLHLGVDNFIISDKEIVEEIWKKNMPKDEQVNAEVDNQNTRKSRFSYLNPIMCLKKVVNHIKKKKVKRDKRRAKEILNKSAICYDHFKATKLNILYGYSKKDMCQLEQSCDAFICGSDQIWSLLKKNFDEYFFLGFTKKKKISYATSIGSEHITDEQKDTLRVLLKDFSHISVREKKTSEQLTEILSKDVEWVADPTLLFDRSFWENETNDIEINKSKYLLCYFLENKEWYFKYAKKLAKQLGLKMLLLPSKYEYCFNKNVYAKEVGPLEFVKLVEQAGFVLTDSYHGALFSLNYNKQFMYLKRFDDDAYDCQNIRIYSILEYLKLEELIVEKKDFERKNPTPVDYSKVSVKLDKLRQYSRDYLYRSLYGEK